MSYWFRKQNEELNVILEFEEQLLAINNESEKIDFEIEYKNENDDEVEDGSTDGT